MFCKQLIFNVYLSQEFLDLIYIPLLYLLITWQFHAHHLHASDIFKSDHIQFLVLLKRLNVHCALVHHAAGLQVFTVQCLHNICNLFAALVSAVALPVSCITLMPGLPR